MFGECYWRSSRRVPNTKRAPFRVGASARRELLRPRAHQAVAAGHSVGQEACVSAAAVLRESLGPGAEPVRQRAALRRHVDWASDGDQPGVMYSYTVCKIRLQTALLKLALRHTHMQRIQVTRRGHDHASRTPVTAQLAQESLPHTCWPYMLFMAAAALVLPAAALMAAGDGTPPFRRPLVRLAGGTSGCLASASCVGAAI